MKKCFKKAISGILTASMLFSSVAFVPTSTSVVAAATTGSFSTVGGWNESLYAEWADQNPDNTAVKVGYKLSGDANYTYLTGDDYTYLIRPVNASLGRVDIPGLKAGTYDLEVTSSDGTVYTQTGIQVTANDRSGYAFWNRSDGAGVGAYNDDGTPKDNAIIVYVTDENKDKVEVPGYEGKTWSYTPSTSAPYTRTGVGIGNILNNNMKLMQDVTITDNHPIIFRFVGKVNVPQNLTPGGTKDPILGGGTDDNGNLAITKYGRNITIEGIGSDATIEGWGFTFSQTSTCPTEAGKNFEVRNLTFENYPEDGLAFQGDNGLTSPIQRVWVHNNTFYPGHADKDYSSDGDKKEGDGSCDFKRGQYYTMSYNHFVKCHKTNLLGSGGSDAQYYMTLHHNWYEQVGSRQPLMASGNIHIYNTYFQGATDTTVDCRYNNVTLLENNYYDNCKNYFKSRTKTCYAKSYGEIINGGSIGSVTGTRTVATSRTQSALASSYTFPDGTSMKDFDISTANFYYDATNKKSDVQVLNATADVPAYVKAHAGVLSVGTASEDTTETTTVTTTEATTKEAITETTTAVAPEPTPSGDYVVAGTYNLNDTTLGNAKTGTYNNITYSVSSVEADHVRIKNTDSIKFKVAEAMNLTITFTQADVSLNGTVIAKANSPYTVALTPGTEYTLAGATSSNARVSTLKFASSSVAPTETTTVATTEPTTVTTTVTTTEATTETTTVTSTEATTKEATSETTTETTPAPSPVTGVNIVADSTYAKVGTQVTIPVRVTGLTSLASLDVNVAYDSSKVTVDSVSNGDVVTDSNAALSYNVANGTVGVAIANPAETVANGDVLFNLVVTPTAEGTATFTITVDEAYAAENKTIEATTTAGTLTIAKADPVGPTIVKGDADKNGLVEKNDVTTILNYVAGLISSTEIDTEAADVNEDDNVTTRDAYIIQKYLNTGSWN